MLKFSPEGAYLARVIRAGEGPGEIARGYRIAWWEDAILGCLVGFPSRIVCVSLDGSPAGAFVPRAKEDALRNSMYMESFHRHEGVVVGSGVFDVFDNGARRQEFFLSSFDSNANDTHCFERRPYGYDFRKAIEVDEEADYVPAMRWTCGPDGNVYIAPDRVGYVIDIYDASGFKLRRITRDWAGHRRTGAEKEAAKDRYSFGASWMEMPEISYKLSDFDHSIDHLFWVRNELWVVTTDAIRRAGTTGSFIVDVFDSTGVLPEERDYRMPPRSSGDRLHWLEDGRAVLVKNYADARLAVRNRNTSVQVGDKQILAAADGNDNVLEVILFVQLP